jgi:ribonuclease G
LPRIGEHHFFHVKYEYENNHSTKGIEGVIKLLVNARTNEKRIAVLDDNKLVELLVEQPGRQLFVGDIYKGRVSNVIPGLQAAFVDLGIGKTGYLHKSELISYTNSPLSEAEKQRISISELITEGSEVIVQIVKESFGSKGPKITENVSIQGNKIIYFPYGNHIGVSRKLEDIERERLRQLGEMICVDQEGIILRTSSEGLLESELNEEIQSLREKWEAQIIKSKGTTSSLIFQDSQLLEKVLRDFGMKEIDEVIVDDRETFLKVKELAKQYPNLNSRVEFYRERQDLFTFYEIERVLEKALSPHVWLKNGGHLIIEKTEAMTVIDVNTGKFTGKQNLKETVLKTNILAATEIANQIRLRNISGMIIIDFISMADQEHLRLVENALLEGVKKDRTKVHPFGFTSLGLYQLTRKKVQEPLENELMINCSCCNGTGRVQSPSTIAYKIKRDILQYRDSAVEAIWLEVSKEVSILLNDESNRMLSDWKKTLQIKIYLSTHDEHSTDYYIRQVGEDKDVKERFRLTFS